MLEIENLHYSYGHSPLLEGLCLKLKPYQLCGIVGRSGSGKSTLARVLMGLIKPCQGAVILDDKRYDFKECGYSVQHARKARIAMVFQNPHHQLLGYKVIEDVLFGISALSKTEQQERVDEVLSLIPLASLLNKPIASLSGGQKQLLALASVLVLRPRLLILDEVTSMLDGETSMIIRSLLEQLRKQMTVLSITHDPHLISAMDSIAVVHQGKIVAHDTPAKVYGQKLSEWDIAESVEVKICKALACKGRDIGIHPRADELMKALCLS